MVVVHSNPLWEPGSGDAGGMTVYVREMARALASSGVSVDVFTRRDHEDLAEVTPLRPGVRVIQIAAGPPSLSKEELPAFLPEFTCNLAAYVERNRLSYEVIHSHYWLSGKVASRLSERWGVPFVHTFHTLGRVKNGGLRLGDRAEPESRLCGESRVISRADAIVASTPDERDWLVNLYAAHPDRVHLIPPGVDHRAFHPGDGEVARRMLGLEGRRVVLFVGRLQPLKGPDVAIEAFAGLVRRSGSDGSALALVVVGGPSGPTGVEESQRLRRLASDLRVAEQVLFVGAQPHLTLPIYYQAAEVCLVPSFTESFGLVALEAQASGVPVVGSAAGGLRSIVKHDQTGLLVEVGSASAMADAAFKILEDPGIADAMSRAAVHHARQFSWGRSVVELRSLYAARD